MHSCIFLWQGKKPIEWRGNQGKLQFRANNNGIMYIEQIEEKKTHEIMTMKMVKNKCERIKLSLKVSVAVAAEVKPAYAANEKMNRRIVC